jgi:hypothetical protein
MDHADRSDAVFPVRFQALGNEISLYPVAPSGGRRQMAIGSAPLRDFHR